MMMTNKILTKIITCVLAVCFLSSLAIALYHNYMLKQQLAKSNGMIDILINERDIVNDLIPLKQDSLGNMFYVFRKSDDEGIITYERLDSLNRNQSKIIEMKDAVILTAKKLYNFDYKVSFKGDTCIVVNIWDKSKNMRP